MKRSTAKQAKHDRLVAAAKRIIGQRGQVVDGIFCGEWGDVKEVLVLSDRMYVLMLLDNHQVPTTHDGRDVELLLTGEPKPYKVERFGDGQGEWHPSTKAPATRVLLQE
jgi:hypothetical protein